MINSVMVELSTFKQNTAIFHLIQETKKIEIKTETRKYFGMKENGYTTY